MKWKPRARTPFTEKDKKLSEILSDIAGHPRLTREKAANSHNF